MTNITVLAQSLKRRATSANEFGESLYVKGADVIALVETLEKAQETLAFQQGEIKALLSSLESRTVTVKLPNQTEFDDPLSAYEAIEKCKDALAAAGIKVEAE
ncbi:hypothetical protein [Klebsiella variicola]|uniref:hypothetical protein n=1 Tax=Klebsiella variicola TaxID=244366 RepID=UPI002FF896D9|nr:hypothetical protein [Klebsiella pneumoniae]